MNNEFQVLWTENAINDLTDIINYIAQDNPEITKIISNNIENKSQSLKTFPLQGRKIPELSNTELNFYRELIEQKWRIMYYLDKKTVYIVTILDSRRNVKKIIFKKIIEN